MGSSGLDLDAADDGNLGSVVVVVVGEVVGVVDYADDEGTRGTMGNLFAVAQLLLCDLEEVTARALVGVGEELGVPGHVLDLDVVVNGLLFGE